MPRSRTRVESSITDCSDIKELTLVSEHRRSLRQRQAQAAATRKHVIGVEDIDELVESLDVTEWKRVREMLGGTQINVLHLKKIFEKQAKALGWKTDADIDVGINPNSIRSWVREKRMGDIAIQMQKDLSPYSGLPTREILEKIVYDCHSQAEKIRRWLFESGAANVSDTDLLKAYPKIQDAAIKGIQVLSKLNEHQLRKEGKLDGAREMAEAIHEVVKGTPLEAVVNSLITDVVIDIEGEDAFRG